MKKYKLKYPIVVDAQHDKPEYKIELLCFPDRIKTKHAKLLPDDTFTGEATNPSKFINLIANMTGIDLKIAEEIDFIDLVNIIREIIQPFLSELGQMQEQSGE